MAYKAHPEVFPYITDLQSKVLSVLKRHSQGLIASEVIAITGLYDYTVRPRLTELFKLGYLTKAGKRQNPRGVPETIYRVVESLR